MLDCAHLISTEEGTPVAANKVRADYDTLAEIANSFEREAEKIRKTLTQLHRALDVLLDGGWRGRGSAEFYREMIAQLLPALKRLAEALERAAQAVRQISRIMKRAEDESAALFKTVAPEIEAGPAEGGGAEARGKAPVKAGDPPPWVWSLLPGVPLLAWLLSVLSIGAAAQGEAAAKGEPAAAPSG